jgi:oxygen-independent coproporphyrinogen-3 oxidase
VQKLLSLSPDRVALFGYAHVPWMAKRQSMIPTDALPSPEERLELYETARKLFLWDGYAEIGIDHFARPRATRWRGRSAPAPAPELPGLHRRHLRDADRHGRLGDFALSAGLRPERRGDLGLPGAGARRGELATKRGHAFTEEDLTGAAG